MSDFQKLEKIKEQQDEKLFQASDLREQVEKLQQEQAKFLAGDEQYQRYQEQIDELDSQIDSLYDEYSLA